MSRTRETLRIFYADDAPDGTHNVAAGGWGLTDASTNPCAHCPSKCCSFRVPLTTIECLRIAYTLQVPFAEIFEISPVVREGVVTFSAPIVTDDGDKMIVIRRPEEFYCTHLLRPGTPTARCGIYELRPAACRLFPFNLSTESRDLALGPALEYCPVRWLVTPSMKDRIANDFDAWRADTAIDIEITDRWAASDEQKTEAAFVHWLMNVEARRHAFDPMAFEPFPARKDLSWLRRAGRQV